MLIRLKARNSRSMPRRTLFGLMMNCLQEQSRKETLPGNLSSLRIIRSSVARIPRHVQARELHNTFSLELPTDRPLVKVTYCTPTSFWIKKIPLKQFNCSLTMAPGIIGRPGERTSALGPVVIMKAIVGKVICRS